MCRDSCGETDFATILISGLGLREDGILEEFGVQIVGLRSRLCCWHATLVV